MGNIQTRVKKSAEHTKPLFKYAVGKDSVHGILFFRRNGRAGVRIEGREDPISLAQGASGTALDGDEVELRRFPPRKAKGKPKKKFGGKPGKPRYGVAKILKRGTDEFLGYLSQSGKKTTLVAESSRLHVPFKVVGDSSAARNGEKVLAKFHRWDSPAPVPSCRIIRVLGPAGDPVTDHVGILAKYGLSGEFPQNVVEEAEKTPSKVQPKDLTGRRDLRKVFTLTIDPLDARDFDDALSLRSLENGDLEVGVHIADVSAYVKPDSALDHEARRRGNSTYLVGEVVPMLPQKLSNGICSLVEDEDRLVKSVLFRFGKDGNFRESKLAESVIRSDKRLTYEQAKLFMTEKDLAAIRSAKPPQSRYSGNPGIPLSKIPEGILGQIRGTIKTLWSIASKLRVSRLRAGSLDLASSEVKILVDARGVPERIIQIQNDDSHSLIEEFMLLANETVAKELRKRKLPGLHRVHPDPDPENLEELRAFVSLYDLSCGDLTNRKEVTKLLASIHKHPLAQVLRIKFLRSLKQACYRATPDGHYGLAKQDYLHFTSPIRRYADLVVHRIVEGILSSEQRKRPDAKRLDGIAKHISVTERNSVDAERESVKTKLVAFYERELKENKPTPHDAVITDIIKKGFFIELPDTLARGFVPLRTLPRDQNYRIATNGTSIVGRDPRKRLKLGQRIKVLVYQVDHAEKQIDFKLAGK